MAYELREESTGVTLGGINKKTGKKNPTELEGYLLGSEKRANKFDPSKSVYVYKFQTSKGDVQIFATAGLHRLLDGAVLGVMTKIVDTGTTKDVGKGNPMRVFQVFQDKENAILDLSSQTLLIGSDDNYEELDEEEAAPSRPTAPATAAPIADAERRAKMQALLNRSKVKSA